MTLDDLAADMERQREEFVAFSDRLTKPLTQDEQDRRAELYARAHFARDVWCIARDFGMAAAALFKLSDGNIDPRSG